jgi:hypothetical protein
MRCRSRRLDQGRRGLTRLSARPVRRGSLLVELAMAIVLLSIAMTLTLKVLGWAAHDGRAAERRERGVLEVANLMEQITAYRFEEVTPELAAGLKLSEPARESLPDAQLSVELKDGDRAASEGLAAKRIAIRLRWRGARGSWEAQVRLTSWIFARRKDS